MWVVTYQDVCKQNSPFEPVPPQFWPFLLLQSALAQRKRDPFIIIYKPNLPHPTSITCESITPTTLFLLVPTSIPRAMQFGEFRRDVIDR